jgi:hypothetical protein
METGGESFHPNPRAMTASPSQLKAQALETGTTVWHDGLTVTPEGMFVICGRRCTLNEAIMYLGNRAVTRAKVAD